MQTEREVALRIARFNALADKEKHTYLPQTEEETKEFQPHEWVIKSVIEALRKDGLLQR